MPNYSVGLLVLDGKLMSSTIDHPSLSKERERIVPNVASGGFRECLTPHGSVGRSKFTESTAAELVIRQTPWPSRKPRRRQYRRSMRSARRCAKVARR